MIEPVILAKTDAERIERRVALEALLVRLVELNPEALLLEPRDQYDLALVDITDDPKDHWPRKEKVFVAVYGTGACIEAIKLILGVEGDDAGNEEDEGYDADTAAWEWLGYNTSGAWVGEGTPTFTCYGCDISKQTGSHECMDHDEDGNEIEEDEGDVG